MKHFCSARWAAHTALCILALGSMTLSSAAQARVALISTALHHVSVVEVPEAVENVAVGSPQVHVEWHGKSILIEPLKAGVDTNMVVFTARTQYLYEIAPATDPDAMSWIVKEKGPAPPPEPPAVKPAQVEKDHDKLYTSLLMTTHDIDSSSIRLPKHSVDIRVVQVSVDDTHYYIRFRATNKTHHTYRLQNPLVLKIDPAFGTDIAYKNVYRQIPIAMFRIFRAYQQTPVYLHASTIQQVDMPHDSSMEWVIVISKPEILPSLFRFTFPADQEGGPINVAAIF